MIVCSVKKEIEQLTIRNQKTNTEVGMLNPSTVPLPGWRKVVNDGGGNKCMFCGHQFDVGGTCNNGHKQGGTYYLPPLKTQPTEPIVVKSRATDDLVVCRIFDGDRCSICSGRFHGEYTICSNGHHIGLKYTKV